MHLTILQTGDVPDPLRHRFGPYADMFKRMLEQTGDRFSFTTIKVNDGEPLPEAGTLDGVLITGSSAGVYDDLPWIEPLRAFIRQAYGARTPMVGVCFGHQVMADALGGDVRKSDKGWGIGRQSYEVARELPFLPDAPPALRIACSHQDQVLVAPAQAQVVLRSAFTPHAGLLYRNGAAFSVQPHPEFADDYSLALAELRRGEAPDAVVQAAVDSFATPSNSPLLATGIARFLAQGTG